MTKTFIAATGEGLARAVPQSDGVWQVTHILQDAGVHCVAADPHNANTLYAGTSKRGLLRCDDGGAMWRTVGLMGHVIRSVAVSPHDSNVIFAGTRPAYLFVSSDGGANWRELDSFRKIPGRRWWFSPAGKPWTAYVSAIAPSPTEADVLLAGIEFGALLRSEDGGASWSKHLKGGLRDCHDVNFHPSDGQWAYQGGGTGGGVSISKDGGHTWNKHKDGLDRNYGWTVVGDPSQPDLMYASLAPGPILAHTVGKAQAHIFRSKGGSAWEKLSGGLPDPLTSMPYALLSEAGAVYAGLGNGDIWFSGDAGDLWEQLPLNLGGIYTSMVMF
jgi:photosystem II stability/assembly factor-like uncharacterized protein